MSTRNVERVFPIKVARREAKVGYSTPKKQQAEPTQRGKQPAFAGIPQNGGVLGAAPLGEGEVEKPKALERGGDFPPWKIIGTQVKEFKRG
jgi:hypothetical protein